MMSTGVVLAVGFQLSGIQHFKIKKKNTIVIVDVNMNSVS